MAPALRFWFIAWLHNGIQTKLSNGFFQKLAKLKQRFQGFNHFVGIGRGRASHSGLNGMAVLTHIRAYSHNHSKDPFSSA